MGNFNLTKIGAVREDVPVMVKVRSRGVTEYYKDRAFELVGIWESSGELVYTVWIGDKRGTLDFGEAYLVTGPDGKTQPTLKEKARSVLEKMCNQEDECEGVCSQCRVHHDDPNCVTSFVKILSEEGISG